MSEDEGQKFDELLNGPRQLAFDFMEKEEYLVELVGTTPEGFGLFRKEEPHGGYSYWTDEIAPGIMVYDQALTNVVTLFAALEHAGEGELWWRHVGEVFGYTQKK